MRRSMLLLLLAVPGSLANVSSAADRVVTDPLILSAIMTAARGDLAHLELTYVVNRVDIENSRQMPKQHYHVAWAENGFRVQVLTLGEEANRPFDDDILRQYDAVAGEGLMFDGVADAYVSTVPSLLGLSEAMPEMVGVLGVFPMRTLCGEANLKTDPIELLGSGNAVVAPNFVTVNGVQCVAVSLLDPSTSPMTLRATGYYAPSLGYAQVRMDVFSEPDGRPLGRWEMLDWIDRGPDSVALPLSARHTRWTDGDVAGVIDMTIEGTGGQRAIDTIDGLNLQFDLPAGTAVHNYDTGKVTIVSVLHRESPFATAGVARTPAMHSS